VTVSARTQMPGFVNRQGMRVTALALWLGLLAAMSRRRSDVPVDWESNWALSGSNRKRGRSSGMPGPLPLVKSLRAR
jgi:hypothetical protein